MIPQRLHLFWGGPPLPDELREYVEEWQRLHPDWEFNLWSPETLPTLRNQDMFDDPDGWSPVSNPWQWRSDLARYELMYDYGGVWVDCDLWPLHPIDDLLYYENFVCREDDNWIANGILGCEPGSALMADMLDGIRESAAAQPKSRVNVQIGPQYLTRVMERHPEVTVLPSWTFLPVHWSDLDQFGKVDLSGSYTVHLWWNKHKLTGRR